MLCQERKNYYEQQLDNNSRSGHDDQQEEPSSGESSSCPNACQPRQDWCAIHSWRNDIPQAVRCPSDPCCGRYRQQQPQWIASEVSDQKELTSDFVVHYQLLRTME